MAGGDNWQFRGVPKRPRKPYARPHAQGESCALVLAMWALGLTALAYLIRKGIRS